MRVTTVIFSALFFLIAFLSTNELNAQYHELMLLNGKKLTIADYKIDTSDVLNAKIHFTSFKGRTRSKYIDEVFSVTSKGGQEKIFYRKNLEEGDIYSKDEMKLYLEGEYLAMTHYSEPWSMLLGGVTGFGGVLMPGINIETNNFNGDLPIGIALPAAYIVGVGSITPDAENCMATTHDKLNNEYFLMGCQEGIRKKRLKNSIIGVGIGIAAGFITLAAVN